MSIESSNKYRNKLSGALVLAVFISAQNYVDAYNKQASNEVSKIKLHDSLNPLDAGYAILSDDGKRYELWFKRVEFNDKYEPVTSSDERVESDVKNKKLTYPRIEKSHIDNMMKSVTYSTQLIPNTTTTVATAILHLGHLKFTLACETMACVDPRNFNAELGIEYAIEKAEAAARNKLWELEGFSLAKEITADKGDFADRMRVELEELSEKVVALAKFVDFDNDVFNSLDAQDRALLSNQLSHMESYEKVLNERLKRLVKGSA